MRLCENCGGVKSADRNLAEIPCCCEKAELAAPSGYATGVEAEVCADIAARQRKGVEKYGVTVAENPLPLEAWLQHAYEETLDKAVYLKRALQELRKSHSSVLGQPTPETNQRK